MENKVIIVTQARLGSSRFPNKILENIGNDTMLSLHLKRLQDSKLKNAIVVATTHEQGVERIEEIVTNLGLYVYKGSTNDVLDRFYNAVKFLSPDYVVRVTSDCPLIDSNLVDKIIEFTILNDLDYGFNGLVENYPDGQDVEVFKFSALEDAWLNASLQSEREHVTPYIRNNSSFKGVNKFKSDNYSAPQNYNHIRMTVDEPADIETIRLLVEELGTSKDWLTYTNYIIENSEKLKNQNIIRNEGYLKSLQNDKQ